MTKKIGITIILLWSLFLNTSNCQITFDDGYYIDDSGNKVNCKIKNDDSYFNPTTLSYKLETGTEILVRGIENTREFGIPNEFKYVKSKVGIDKSKSSYSKLDNKINVNNQDEVLFLKVLLEGYSSLYEYKESGVERYFYKIKEEPIKQLDYKKYKSGANKIRENNRYKQQMKIEMSCESTDKLIESLDYKRKSLLNFFKQYNSCKKSNFKVYSKTKKEKRVRLGIQYEGMLAKNTLFFRGNEFFKYDAKLVNQFGLSFEYILPFKKNKWRIFIEPTYYQYKAEKKSRTYVDAFNLENVDTYEIEHQAIEVPLGFRYYIYLIDKVQIFISGGYYIDAYSRAKIKENHSNQVFSEDTIYLSKQSLGNILMGFGIQYDRFSIDYRYKRGKDFTVNTTGWLTAYRGSSISLRVNVF